MSTARSLAALLVVLGAGAALAESPNLGRSISEADIKGWDITILPDGSGLPAGQGTPAEGAKIYVEKCVACHGEGGVGGPGGRALVGGPPLTDGIETRKTIKNYFAYPTTIFDQIRRAMPFNAPKSLSDNEVYALTAYLLSINKLIGEADVMDAASLPRVRMPNRDGFVVRFPERL